jgi:hypothetical protein
MIKITKVEKVYERLMALLSIIVDKWSKKDKLRLYSYLIADLTDNKIIIEAKK